MALDFDVTSILLICFCRIINVASDTCEGSLNFQSAPAITSIDPPSFGSVPAPSSFYATYSVLDLIQCANTCYNDVNNLCTSALFEPSQQGGKCRLSQSQLPCVPRGRFKRHNVLSQISPQGRVLFCFRCIESGDITRKLPPATVPLPELQLDTITSDVNSTSPIKDAPTEEIVHVDHEFEMARNPNFLIGNSQLDFIRLRVMTFNTWVAGSNVYNGLGKIASHIASNNPDIVVLQEMKPEPVDQLLRILGDKWSRCRANNGDSDFILTRHMIIEHYQPSSKLWNTGCRIKLLDHAKFVNVWGVHLDWRDYGPYTACFYRPTRQTELYEMLSFNEHKFEGQPNTFGRMNNILGLITHPQFAQNMKQIDTIPLIVAGDFNAPSHLDWTTDTRILHCNTSYDWPVSKLLQEANFKDSFRQVYPNPSYATGFTWTPVHKMNPDDPAKQRPEPQDRIDFIYYQGNYIRAKSSTAYKGYNNANLYPYHNLNDWPSDHAAVVTDFDLLLIQ